MTIKQLIFERYSWLKKSSCNTDEERLHRDSVFQTYNYLIARSAKFRDVCEKVNRALSEGKKVNGKTIGCDILSKKISDLRATL